MPHIVKGSPQAIEDVGRVYKFLASKNIEAASSSAMVILKQAEILEVHSNAGKPAADLEPEHRELVVPFGASGYVLLYEIEDDNVLVFTVRHQKEVGY